MKKALIIAAFGTLCAINNQPLFGAKLTEEVIKKEAEGLIKDSVNMKTRNDVFKAYAEKTDASTRGLFFYYYAQAKFDKFADQMRRDGITRLVNKTGDKLFQYPDWGRSYADVIKHLVDTIGKLKLLNKNFSRNKQTNDILKDKIVENKKLQALVGYPENSNAFYPLLAKTSNIISEKYKKQ